MTLLRVLENICLTPVVEILDLRYRWPRRKCRGKSPEDGCKVVRRRLMAKASANGPQGHAKVTGRKDTGKAIRVRLSDRGIN
jgi:hypothetical protein